MPEDRKAHNDHKDSKESKDPTSDKLKARMQQWRSYVEQPVTAADTFADTFSVARIAAAAASRPEKERLSPRLLTGGGNGEETPAPVVILRAHRSETPLVAGATRIEAIPTAAVYAADGRLVTPASYTPAYALYTVPSAGEAASPSSVRRRVRVQAKPEVITITPTPVPPPPPVFDTNAEPLLNQPYPYHFAAASADPYDTFDSYDTFAPRTPSSRPSAGPPPDGSAAAEIVRVVLWALVLIGSAAILFFMVNSI